MLQFTKMELGVEVQSKAKPGPESQLSPLSSVSSISSSPEALMSPDSNSRKSPEPSRALQASSGMRSLASMKAKSLKDRALKRSRGKYLCHN